MAKTVPPLTSAKIRNLKPLAGKTVELVDGAVPGLRIRMTPSGSKTWSLNVRDARGKRRRFDVGQGLGLAEARRRAQELRQAIREGFDPLSDKKEARHRAKAAQAGLGTFKRVVDAYFETGPGQHLKSRYEQLKRIKSVFSNHLNRPALEIEPAEIQLTADGHRAPVAAARAVGYAGPLLAWATKRGLMKPGFDIDKPDTAISNHAFGGQHVLSEEDLCAIWPKLNDGHGLAAKFLVYTATRLRETTAATWAEVDMEARTWTIPAGRRKDTRSKRRRKQIAQRDLVISLPRQALELLSHLEPGDPDDLIFRGARGCELQNWDRWTKRIQKETGTKGWDRHALRRTVATLAADCGAAPHVIQALLGHRNIGGQLVAGYSKSGYTREVATALQKVADHIDSITQPRRQLVTLLRSA